MSDIQSIGFKRSMWTPTQAKKWIKDHGFKPMKMAIEKNYIKFRFQLPSEFKKIRTKDVGDGIHFIFGFK